MYKFAFAVFRLMAAAVIASRNRQIETVTQYTAKLYTFYKIYKSEKNKLNRCRQHVFCLHDHIRPLSKRLNARQYTSLKQTILFC